MSHRLHIPVMLLALVACSGQKRAAEDAVAAADSAVTAITPEAERAGPELLQPLTTALGEAKAALESRDYETAVARASDIPARATEVSAKLEQNKKDLAADFATLSEAMPRNIAAIQLRLLRPPRSLSRERVAELKATADSATVQWDAIKQEFQGGAMASAMGKAFGLKARVSEAMVALGLSADEKAWGNLITQPR